MTQWSACSQTWRSPLAGAAASPPAVPDESMADPEGESPAGAQICNLAGDCSGIDWRPALAAPFGRSATSLPPDDHSCAPLTPDTLQPSSTRGA